MNILPVDFDFICLDLQKRKILQQHLGTDIRQARASQQLLLRKAAAALDIEAGLVSLIERNKSHPTHDQIQRFSQMYQLDTNTLLID